MDFKKYRRIVNNPRHIPGIHNYCDRWCERCPFTLRCSVFAVGVEVDKEKRDLVPNGSELFARLETPNTLAKNLIEANLDHPGVGQSELPESKNHGRPVDTHRAGVAAKRYMEFAHKFITKQQYLLPNRAPAPDIHAVSAAEAFEVISWYHMLIMVKLSRALSQHEFEDEIADDPDLADMPRDEDGSAKIALIAIDRSILAWAVLRLYETDLAEPALRAMLTLHRLRAAVEKALPAARAFVRPGFDTYRFPKHEK